ncbi:HD domain-containing protein [Patescibacteria group bacterium]|nr:HD domain-containing protein [Patescibacteria group bacterium]MBU1921677.1 HD domain-containing protein [Patescibacteria group bacterium]
MNYQDKVYGGAEISEPVLLDVLNSSALQRLKHVNQYGTWVLVRPDFNTTRFEHSVGVMILLKKFGADLSEQIAGLIHDVSHAAFSHVVDYLFGREKIQDYHDEFSEQIVAKTDLPGILRKHGFDIGELLNEDNFSLLKQPMPALCADRLDYFLRDGMVFRLFDKQFSERVLGDVKILDKKFIFQNLNIAQEAAEMWLKIGEFIWSNPLQSTFFQILADAMKVGLERGIISHEDLFGTDQELLTKLKEIGCQEILDRLALIGPDIKIKQVDADWDFHVFTKARSVDPWVSRAGEIKLLSEIVPEFKKRLQDFIESRKDGYKIKILAD